MPTNGTAPAPADREALVREIEGKRASGRWEGTPVRRVLMAAQALFDRVRRERADLAALRGFYLREVAATDSETFLGGMVACYLATYVPSAPHRRSQSGRIISVPRAAVMSPTSITLTRFRW